MFLIVDYSFRKVSSDREGMLLPVVASVGQKVTCYEVAISVADFDAAVKSFFEYSKNHTQLAINHYNQSSQVCIQQEGCH